VTPPTRGNAPGVRAEFFVVAALFLALGALRINDLCLYTPDSARYVIWGNSIARGEGYLDDTQPENLRYVVHAPLYPALIAPAELIFPLGVAAVKALTLLWGLLALLLLYLWLHHLFGRIPAVTGAAMFAFNPGFLVYSTEPLSEAPFMAFLLLVLFLMWRRETTGGLTAASWWILIVTAALIGLLREVGVVVTGCVAARLWFTDRKKALTLSALAVLCLGGWYVRNTLLVGVPPGAPGGNASLVFQHFMTAPDAPVLAELAARVWSNASSYAGQLCGMAFYPLYGPQHTLLLDAPVEVPAALRWAVVFVFGAIIGYGVLRSVRSGRGGGLPAVTGAGLFLAAALYPVNDSRFIAPLLPLMIVFLIAGLPAAGRSAGRRAGPVLAAGALLLLPNLPALAGLVRLNSRYTASPGELRASPAGKENSPFYYTQPWGLLGAWMRGNLPADAALATPAKELALVAGGRKVLELDPGVPQSVFDRLLRTNGVSHLLAPVRWGDLRVYERLISGSRRCVFTEVHREGNLHLYGVDFVPFDRDRGARAAGPAPVDAAGRLRAAMEMIDDGEYRDATAMLDSAVRLAPMRPEIRYEQVVAAAIGGDSASARAAFGELIALPQVASYIFPARNHLLLAALAGEVAALPPGEERAMRTLDVSRRYWEMGFYDRAKTLLGSEMSGDSSFFVGHLWDFHYNFQTGDTSAARLALNVLDRIDSANSLVRNFHALMVLRRAVRTSSVPADRGALRLRMARIDADIELFDEAFDQAQAAAAEDSSSTAALLFQAGLYAKQGYPRRALFFYRQALRLTPDDAALRSTTDSLSLVAGNGG
jgi:tetratricopeptide (TPR) repeat protein/4-amino-4-deoxy-L-arabinose transferase-like glycosyltransferase